MNFDKTGDRVCWALLMFAATVGWYFIAAHLFGRPTYIESALTIGAVVGVLEYAKARWSAREREAEHE